MYKVHFKAVHGFKVYMQHLTNVNVYDVFIMMQSQYTIVTQSIVLKTVIRDVYCKQGCIIMKSE